MKKLQFIDIGKPFRIIGKICKDIERAFRFKGINVNFIVMMIDYIGFAFILKWNLHQSFAIRFFQLPCHHDHLAVSLSLPVSGQLRDSHPIENAHAEHT